MRCRYLQSGLPDEIAIVEGNRAEIAAGSRNRESLGLAEAAVEIDLECESQGVEPGPEVGARGRDAKLSSAPT